MWKFVLFEEGNLGVETIHIAVLNHPYVIFWLEVLVNMCACARTHMSVQINVCEYGYAHAMVHMDISGDSLELWHSLFVLCKTVSLTLHTSLSWVLEDHVSRLTSHISLFLYTKCFYPWIHLPSSKIVNKNILTRSETQEYEIWDSYG